jgi:acyl-homoserine-lactone acylase
LGFGFNGTRPFQPQITLTRKYDKMSADSAEPSEALQDKVEILWDEFGIPHIYGRDLPAVIRGYGYARMENHAELILQNIALARGRAAEYFGPGPNNQNVTNDEQVLTYGIPQRSEDWLGQSDQFQRKLIDSFVAGANEYAGGYLGSISPAFQQVLPVKAADALAPFQYTIHFNFMTYQSNVAKLISDWSAAKPREHAEEAHEKVRKASNGWALPPPSASMETQY